VGCCCSATAAFLVRWRLVPAPLAAFSALFFDRLDGEGLELVAGAVVEGRTGVGVVTFTVGAMGLAGLMVGFELERGTTVTLAVLLGIATTTAGAALTVGTLPVELARGSTVTLGAEGSMLWLICASFRDVWTLLPFGLRMILLEAGTPPTTPGPGTVNVAAAGLLGAIVWAAIVLG
jgi:hypothetical protein